MLLWPFAIYIICIYDLYKSGNNEDFDAPPIPFKSYPQTLTDYTMLSGSISV